jgi:hypothetical protein
MATQNMVVGKLRIVGDGARSLDAEDQVRIYEQVQALQDLPIGADDVLLLDPLYPSLEFGPGGSHEVSDDPMRGNIRFNGGTWAGPSDHPLLPALLKSHREIIELRPAEQPRQLYACPECDAEFDTKAKVKAHQRAAHKE